MKKEWRLTRKEDFANVRQRGRSWAHPLMIMGAAPNKLTATRLGFLTVRQINKAVARNRARRLLREAARQLYPRMQPGWDLVLIARQPIIQVKCQAVVAALEELLQRANLLTDREI